LTGVAAMTAAQTIEMRISGRPPSMVPGHVASKLLGLDPKDDEALARISMRMHWAHGMTHGLVRAAIGRTGLRGSRRGGCSLRADVARRRDPLQGPRHRAVALKVEPRGAGPDVLHKGLFVVATSAAYDHDVTIPRGQTT